MCSFAVYCSCADWNVTALLPTTTTIDIPRDTDTELLPVDPYAVNNVQIRGFSLVLRSTLSLLVF